MKDITVFKTWDEPIADMAIDLLKAEGINPIKMSEGTRSVFPMTMDGIGAIEIRVPEDDAKKAIELLAVRFSNKNITDIEEDGFDEKE